MFETFLICEYLNAYDTIRMCCTCKTLYESIDAHIIKTKQTSNFQILEKDEYMTYLKEAHIGESRVNLYLKECGLVDTQKKHKNCEIIVRNYMSICDSFVTFQSCTFIINGKMEIFSSNAIFQYCTFIMNKAVEIDNSNVDFQKCRFIANHHTAFLNITHSNVLYCSCHVEKFHLFCACYDSTANFESTLFSKISIPIIGRKVYSHIFDSQFEKCSMPINFFEQFRLIVRNTIFSNTRIFPILVHTLMYGNYLEIGFCSFINSRSPVLCMPNESTIDTY